jgi:iron-sulfur cluster repair protein YtfE (RIC family)
MTTTSIPAWRDQIFQLRYLAAKVGRVHGPTHPDMATLAEVVATLADSPEDDRVAHAALGHRMRELTADFRPWSGSCASVHQLYQGLFAVTAALPAIDIKTA